MSDDYLWNGSGKPDPDVERLERLLSRLRSDRPAPELPGSVIELPPGRWHMSRAAVVPRLAAAAVIVLMAAGAWWATRPPVIVPSLDVARLDGAPKVGSKPIRGTGVLTVGEWLETDAGSRARIDVGIIGEVNVEPNSRVQLVRAHESEQRLALNVGKIHARIWAPPGTFFVETPSALAVDVGCAYSLEVDARGAGILRVTKGWVAFQTAERESFIPEGAMCATRPGKGPGTPFYEDAPQELRSAVEKLDFDLGGVAGDVEGGVQGGVGGASQKRAEALAIVLATARKKDVLTLWHLLGRTTGEERGQVFGRMAELLPPPKSVTREGVLAGDRAMLDLWWKELGLKEAWFWRMWSGQWPPRTK